MCVVYESAFRRLSRCGIISRLDPRVAAQCHSRCQKFFFARGAVGFYYRHLVLGKCSRFVRADYLRAAQSFNRRKLTNYRISLAHIRNADGKNYGNNRRQSLRNRSNRKAYRNHKCIDKYLCIYIRGSYQAYRKDYHAYCQHQNRQDFAELCKLDLQRGLALLRLSKSIGNFAHFGVHSRAANHCLATTVNYGAAHINHILSVAKRNILCIPQSKSLRNLAYRNAFAGQRRFFDLQAVAFDYSAICRNRVPGFQNHYVAFYKVFALYDLNLAVSENLAGCRRHLLQGFDSLFRLAFLVHSKERVDDYHRHYDDNICKIFSCVIRGYSRYRSRRDEHDDHRVCHLGKKPLEKRILFSLRQFVLAALSKSFRCLFRSQTLLA